MKFRMKLNFNGHKWTPGMTKNYSFQRKNHEIMLFLQQKQRNIP
jgi:hypothetical protein